MSRARIGALGARWRHASLKTSFMVYMLGFLLLALVLSLSTGYLFSSLRNGVIADSYEASGLYVYDAAGNALVPARSIDIDDQGNELFVERTDDGRVAISLDDPPSSLRIERARSYPYAYQADDGSLLLGFDEYSSLDAELSAYETDDGISPTDLGVYDALAREAFVRWSDEHPGNSFEAMLEGSGASADGSAFRLGDLLASPTGYDLRTTPPDSAGALSALLGVLALLMFPLWFGVCIFAAARRFFKKRLEPGFAVLDRAAANIAAQDLEFSVTYDRDDELGRLATSFETMRASLAASQRALWRTAEERKRLNAAFAHDLRTPLTILKGKIELLEAHAQAEDVPAGRLADSIASLAAQVERLGRYVQAMSGLQKLEDRVVAARPTAFESMVGMIEDAGAGLAACAGRAFSLTVGARCVSELPVLHVDQAVVGEVAENLLNNAMRYATFRVDARIDVRGDELVLVVEDDGPGFSATALERGCAPFFSEAPSAEHFGLGLNIASLMCEKHGGGLELENREAGGARAIARFSLDSRAA